MKVEEKKGYFERRKERKLKKIEQKPVYKWNYKSLYKWLKYKGFDKKYIKQLKKDRLNGYIMLTLEISDLVSLDIPSEMAKRILNTLIETSEKQDNLVDATCECGEVELPLQPVRSTMVYPND
ncbi:predicted protein [Naegleria gruberi]|uniref:Predicted protein n=1 Tax=Naegleria gruberi TaxID=5762 RepID=D2VP53_NAEGR|nr:uncharacterized protein NAEGRDRAFT_70735 [Naegleria gruberi]EFC41371.1 predicted protein [Naegleria gruberi]|eukprot:XP_002674115.1 predicted protein [Naegleria gruberi strain NEG-M]